MQKNNKTIFIGGATATGKSDLAVKMALELNGEIISADSRQVYKGLNIGSGKITAEEMQGVPHFMLDVVGPMQQYSVADYQKTALNCIADIHLRGKAAIICGGTGYYIDSLYYKKEFPEVIENKEIRTELENKSVEELREILETETNGDIGSVDINHKNRIIRGIEINRSLGFIPKINLEKRFQDSEIIITEIENEKHKEIIAKRIADRKDQMITEIKNLLEQKVSKDWLLGLGLEYTYVTQYVLGEISWNECEKELNQKTWQYVKRQKTWFKRYLK